ncbi:right-handed parallel beta-helix repeat-containing protein, partial [Methanobrevibacter sp.]
MSNKKLFLIMLITLILITMGGVWASEDAVADNLTSSDAAELSLSDSVDTKTDAYQTNVNTTSQTTDDSAEADDSSKNTNGELLGATRDEDILGDKEFSQLSSTIGTSGSYVSLDTNYIGSGRTIEITRTLTIEGNNFTITNTKSDQRIFYMNTAQKTVTFQNIKFVGNVFTPSDNSGGAVLYADAGATSSVFKFINCTFENNYVYTDRYRIGGATIFHWGGSLELTNCNFSNNHVVQTGNGHGQLTLQGNTLYARGTNFDMDNCKFNGNYYEYTGTGVQGFVGYGTVYIHSDTVANINRCSFNNSHTKNFAVSDSRGQAIYSYSRNILINNTNFTNNNADKGGAVVFRYYDSQVTVENCKFINNTATDCGGAVMFFEPISNAKFKNCDFINNNASNYGAIYIQPKPASSSSPAVLSVSGLEFTKCNFINNKVTGNNGNGGVILIPHESSGLTFDYCTFTGNTATEDGGAIYFEYGCRNIYIKNSEFDSNVAKSGGAVIFRITLNSQPGFSNINIINSNFTKNKATLDGSYGGSAIAFNKATGVTIKDSRFEENVAEANGALLFQISGNVYIKNSTFIKNNSTKKSAGAIYFYEATNTLKNMTITECSFDKNTANGDRGSNDYIGCGGAVFLEGSGHKLMYNNFTNNEAKGNGTHGGAVFSKANGVTIFKNTFINNSAYSYGGAFTDIQGTGTLTISNSTFTNNSAWDGGAIDLYQTNNAVISNCDFDINHAGRSAGALYMSCDKVVVDNCNFTNNYAPSAGAIYADVSDFTIKNSRFISNKADEYGGAIYLVRGSNILNCNFADNNASDGGAIYVSSGLTAEISDSTFERNNANISGGAIYYGGSSAFSLKITNDTFIENTALNGGAVDYLADSAIPYRDFNLFEGEATSLGNNRYSWNHPANRQIIYSSQFVGNIDYLMNMTAAQIANSYTVLVTITTSKRISRSPEVKITLTYANGTPVDGYTNYIVPSGQLSFEDSDNYTVINIQLTEQEIGDYNITVSIRDNDHQYKQKTANYTVKTLFKGPFEIIQEAIDNATSGWSEGDPIPVVNLTWDVYTYTPQYDEGPIIINSPVIIVGVNNTQINALGYTRLFEINSENVTFINITFKNGNADGNESSADRTHGGAILWNGANGNVINCTFEDNKATEGGAIYWNSTSGTITDSDFNNNNATAGGAVYVNENSADFTVQGTGFMGNDAAGDGGAVYLNSTGNEVINSIFNDNTAHGDGGAVYAEGSENTIIDSEFTLNTADNGGAVYVDGDADIKNSTFTSNQANINGSAIYLNSVSEDTVISNDTFDSNTAHVSGGAIYIRNSDVSVENSTFAQNGAYVHGADICVDDNSEVLLYNLTITNSSSGDASIYVNSDVTVEKTEINSDNAIIFNNGDSKVIDTVISGDNAILINPDGNVNLTGVNTTGSGDYAVSNYGTLYLEGNNFTDIILNYGNITSKTTTRILDGETVEIEIGDNLPLNASISDDAGNIIIVPGLKFVDNATFTQDSTNDGKIHSGNYNNAQQGVYILTVNNTGLKDNTFENTLLKVKDSDVTVTVQTEPVNQGEIIVIKAIIGVTNENLEIGGNVTFEINGLQYKVSLNETEKVNATTFIATAQITDLIPDTYTVTAYYNGDDTHRPAKSDREFFFVNARDSNITVSVNNVAEGQNATATIKTNATNGTIRITVTGRDPVEIVMDGDTYVYDLGALEPGNYTVRVDYVANQFYKASTDSTSFEVYEYDMIVEVSETKYNQTAVINITLPADANGTVEVFLNGENLTDRIIPLGNGVYQVETAILTVLGEYEVNVTYTNGTDGKYYSRNASETFTVDKNDVYGFKLEITPDDITFGDEVNITVTGPAGFEGKLTIDDEEIPFTIGEDGTFTVTRSNFTAGSHTITANITGDENYTSKEITKEITVESATPLMTITVPESVEPNSEANVTVTVGENANGTVYISVDGVTTPVEVKDGVATLPLDTTKPGNYTVTAEFISADANYKSASNTTGADYTVERYNSTITSNVTIAPNNNVTVTVTVEGAGNDSNVTLTLSNGETKTVNVVDGVATFDLGVFDEQKFYNYTAVFNGDKNLNPNSTTGNFTVGGLNNYTVNVTISDTQYGDNTTIKVTIDEPAVGGTVTVYVDETPYTADLVDGVYVVVTPALAVGNYTVNVTYEAKAPYADKNNTGNILTVKTNGSYTFNVDVIPAPFGEDTVINITGPAGENVTVTIDGVEETVTLDKNGTAIIKRDNLTAGPHTVVANITGNENYTSKEISKTVNVPAATPELSIDITQPIAPNTPANITVFVGKNATGTVVVSIDGNVYGSDEVNEDGYAIIPIRDTSVPGTYNVTVKYYAGENDNYNTSSNSTGKTYTIERYDSELSYTAKVSDNNTVTVTVQLNSTATGTVTVKVGEETFNTTIDKGDGGVAVVDLRVFDKSESPVNYEIIYSGDDVFNPK